MTNNQRNIEILAPCGSYDILTAAVKAGADACYIGGIKFGARAYATNLSDSIIKSIEYAHLHDVKLYLTVNTLLKNNEISELYDYLAPYYEAGLDAVIVQDFGVFKFIKDNFPEIPIHCSTQMNITSAAGAAYMKGKGASRVVTAREMSLEEIKHIKNNVDIEIESFVHGAMCYSYSGQCLMSSLAGGRSGNRGRCAQPCRKCYEDKYYLSMKDMCTLEILPDIIEAGIDSLKIEGRMKNEYYVASAVNAYKELTNDYLGGCFNVEKATRYKHKLGAIYNRGGFCNGYYFMHNGPDMISKERPNNQGTYMGKLLDASSGKITLNLEEDLYKQDVLELELSDGSSIAVTSGVEGKKGEHISINSPSTKYISIGQKVYRTKCNKYIQDILENILEKPKKINLTATFTVCVGDYIYLTLQYKDCCVTVTSDEIVTESKTKPADVEQIKQKLDMLGNTDFSFDDIYLSVDENAFVPMGVVKRLRRKALEEISEAIINSYKIVLTDKKPIASASEDSTDKSEGLSEKDIPVYVSVKSLEQLKQVIKYPVYALYMPRKLFDVATDVLEETLQKNIKIYVELPYIITSEFDIMEYVPKQCHGIYIRNIDGYAAYIAHKDDFCDKNVILGASLYGYNNLARKELAEAFDNVVFELPKELNIKELSGLNGANQLSIYGHQLVMLSAQCLFKNTTGCHKSCNTKEIKDDMGNNFYFMSNCDECCNLIYNGVPTSLLHKFDDSFVDKLGLRSLKVDFTIEKETMVSKVLNAVMQLSNNLELKEFNVEKLTTGHYYRGVD